MLSRDQRVLRPIGGVFMPVFVPSARGPLTTDSKGQGSFNWMYFICRLKLVGRWTMFLPEAIRPCGLRCSDMSVCCGECFSVARSGVTHGTRCFRFPFYKICLSTFPCALIHQLPTFFAVRQLNFVGADAMRAGVKVRRWALAEWRWRWLWLWL